MNGTLKKKVLIVEDNTSLSHILTDKITGLGVEVITAQTGQEALTIIKKEKLNLILLDIMLPGGMNGFDLLEQIKADSTSKSVPVIVLTNLSTEQKTAYDIGAVDYIVKVNMSLDDIILKIKNRL